MMEKTKTACRVFFKGFAGLFLTFQCVLGILYWLGNVTRTQKFDTTSVLGKLAAAFPVLPVHLLQTALVFGAAYYLFGRFWERRKSLVCALAALTVPFVMQVCLSETEHAAALAAILCMTAVIADGHTRGEKKISRPQAALLCVCMVILLFCGAAYSCAGSLLFGVCLFMEEKKRRKKKRARFLSLACVLLLCCALGVCGSWIQNRANPDRMQISIESVLLKRFAYPCLDQKLFGQMPQEIQDLYSAGDIEQFYLHPYLLDTTLESDLLQSAGKERTKEIYLELAWFGFLNGTKTDVFMMLEDTLCYLMPQLFYPLYSDGTMLAEFGFSYQQFVSGTTYLAQLYLYGSLLGYAASLLLTLVYGLLCGFEKRFCGLPAAFRRVWPLLFVWLCLSVIFMMRGTAVFNYKYAAFQAILGYLPLLHVLFSQTEGAEGLK